MGGHGKKAGGPDGQAPELTLAGIAGLLVSSGVSIEWLLAPTTRIPQVLALADEVQRQHRRQAVLQADLTTLAVQAALDSKARRQQQKKHRDLLKD